MYFSLIKSVFLLCGWYFAARVCRSALVNLGVRMDKLEVNNDTDLASTPISKIIPGSQAKFDFNRQRLDLNIPQAYIENLPRDWVNPHFGMMAFAHFNGLQF